MRALLIGLRAADFGLRASYQKSVPKPKACSLKPAVLVGLPDRGPRPRRSHRVSRRHHRRRRQSTRRIRNGQGPGQRRAAVGNPDDVRQEGEHRQVNAGNLLLRGVPGVGKTFFGVILAAISNAKFARLQGRADLQPTEVVGFQMINPATGALVTEFGPMASAEVILLDEINRIPLKSQSAFLEGPAGSHHHGRQGNLRAAGVQLRDRDDEPGGARDRAPFRCRKRPPIASR